LGQQKSPQQLDCRAAASRRCSCKEQRLQQDAPSSGLVSRRGSLPGHQILRPPREETDPDRPTHAEKICRQHHESQETTLPASTAEGTAISTCVPAGGQHLLLLPPHLRLALFPPEGEAEE